METPHPEHRFGEDRDTTLHLDERIIQRIHEIAGVYTLRILHWIMAGFIASALTVGGATVWATLFYARVETLIEGQAYQRKEDAEKAAKQEERVAQMEKKQRELENSSSDRWRLSHQRIWRNEMLMTNPTLKLPDPDEIVRRVP